MRSLRNNEAGWFPNWLCLSLKPDVIIGNNYLWRWWILPRNPFFNIYLHKIMRSDDSRALHCHPWHNLSIILKGTYREVTLVDRSWLIQHSFDQDTFGEEETVQLSRFAGEWIFRHARTPHRLVVSPGAPVWSLFVTGPRYRAWGFHLRDRWLHWKDYVAEYGDGRSEASTSTEPDCL